MLADMKVFFARFSRFLMQLRFRAGFALPAESVNLIRMDSERETKVENGTYISKATMTFQLPRPLKDALRDHCEITGETVSTIMRRALIDFLAKQQQTAGIRSGE